MAFYTLNLIRRCMYDCVEWSTLNVHTLYELRTTESKRFKTVPFSWYLNSGLWFLFISGTDEIVVPFSKYIGLGYNRNHTTFQWRYNQHDYVSIHRRLDFYSNLCSGADQRKHQSSASMAFVRGIHQWPVNSPHKGPVTRKMFPFDDVIMTDKALLHIKCQCSAGTEVCVVNGFQCSIHWCWLLFANWAHLGWTIHSCQPILSNMVIKVWKR